MPEEIDYSLFIGKNEFNRTEKDEREMKEFMEEKKRKRDYEDEIAAKRYKIRKQALKQKYSPARYTIPEEEQQEFFKKSNK